MSLDDFNEIEQRPNSYFDPRTGELDVAGFYNDTLGDNTTFTRQQLEEMMINIQEETKNLNNGSNKPSSLEEDAKFLDSKALNQIGRDPSQAINKNIVRVLKMLPGFCDYQLVPLDTQTIVELLSNHLGLYILPKEEEFLRKKVYGEMTHDQHMRKHGSDSNAQRRITAEEMGEVLTIVSKQISWGNFLNNTNKI